MKSISRLLRVIGSNHDGDPYCLGCLHSFPSDRTLKKPERLRANHDYCEVVMPDDDQKILKHQYGTKSLKMSNIIHTDLEANVNKHDTSSNNPDQSYTEKKATHEACGYAMKVIRSYDENIHSFYRGKDCIPEFCKELLDYSREIVNTIKKPI